MQIILVSPLVLSCLDHVVVNAAVTSKYTEGFLEPLVLVVFGYSLFCVCFLSEYCHVLRLYIVLCNNEIITLLILCCFTGEHLQPL